MAGCKNTRPMFSSPFRKSDASRKYWKHACHLEDASTKLAGQLRYAVLAVQKRRNTIDEGLGLLNLGMVPRLGNQFETRPGDALTIGSSVGR